MMSVSAHEDRRGEGAFSSELGWLVGWLAAQSAKSKGEGTVYSRTDHEGPEREKRYSSTVSLTSALDGVGGQRHAPAALPLERSGTHFIRGWVDPRAGLDRCGISRHHRDSIPGPCSL